MFDPIPRISPAGAATNLHLNGRQKTTSPRSSRQCFVVSPLLERQYLILSNTATRDPRCPRRPAPITAHFGARPSGRSGPSARCALQGQPTIPGARAGEEPGFFFAVGEDDAIRLEAARAELPRGRPAADDQDGVSSSRQRRSRFGLLEQRGRDSRPLFLDVGSGQVAGCIHATRRAWRRTRSSAAEYRGNVGGYNNMCFLSDRCDGSAIVRGWQG